MSYFVLCVISSGHFSHLLRQIHGRGTMQVGYIFDKFFSVLPSHQLVLILALAKFSLANSEI